MSVNTAANDGDAPSASRSSSRHRFKSIIGATELLQKSYGAVEYLIDKCIPKGLSILVGKPKFGKSWLLADLAMSVATGSPWNGLDATQGDVLFLALEDNERRLKDRLVKLQGEELDLERLSFATTAPPIGNGFVEAVADWIKSVDDPKLLIVDTYSKIRPRTAGSGDDYAGEYAIMQVLLDLANQHDIAIVLVHHQKKVPTDDPYDGVLGSTALTGAVDTILLLRPTTNGPTFQGKGRDIEEFEWAIEFSKSNFRWSVKGASNEVQLSETAAKVLQCVSDGFETPSDIVEETGLNSNTVRQALGRLVEKSQIVKVSWGKYAMPD